MTAIRKYQLDLSNDIFGLIEPTYSVEQSITLDCSWGKKTPFYPFHTLIYSFRTLFCDVVLLSRIKLLLLQGF